MKKIKYIFVILVFLFLFLIGLFTFILKDNKYSLIENRYFTTKKDLNNSKIENLSTNVENYLNDQFIFRTKVLNIVGNIKLLLGNKELNNTYITKDRLYEKILDNDINYDNLNKNIDIINNLNINSVNKKILLVPSSGIIYKESLPNKIKLYNYSKIINIIKNNLKGYEIIDSYNLLNEHKNDYIYYKTDHHWTSYGAYLGYNLLFSNPVTYYKKNLCNNFQGTLSSKLGININLYDSINISNYNYNVTIYNNDKIINLYDMNKLNEKDKYQVFLGGNYSKLTIINNSLNNNKTLLLVKDSFANSMIPYLINHYNKIIVIDTRYFGESFNNIINYNKIDDVLFLFEANNFANENTMVKLKL